MVKPGDLVRVVYGNDVWNKPAHESRMGPQSVVGWVAAGDYALLVGRCRYEAFIVTNDTFGWVPAEDLKGIP